MIWGPNYRWRTLIWYKSLHTSEDCLIPMCITIHLKLLIDTTVLIFRETKNWFQPTINIKTSCYSINGETPFTSLSKCSAQISPQVMIQMKNDSWKSEHRRKNKSSKKWFLNIYQTWVTKIIIKFKSLKS